MIVIEIASTLDRPNLSARNPPPKPPIGRIHNTITVTTPALTCDTPWFTFKNPEKVVVTPEQRVPAEEDYDHHPHLANPQDPHNRGK
ncbi:hypothetical protein, partial [Arthrobacter sp. AL12]|uniref:hypothetical protein n=1 Tax=Arthrobacter sp. AL12 TaxID=3042241 RepID=UPI002499D554